MFLKLVSSYETTPTMDVFRKKNIKLTCAYFNSKGVHFATIDVETSDFKMVK